MKILIAGGSGFLGSALKDSLTKKGHEVHILSRGNSNKPNVHLWDGETASGWGGLMNEMDAVINLTGRTLEHWPWSKRQKERFLSSRVKPGLALAEAIQKAEHRPEVFIQVSGVNYYGLYGKELADESTPAADDFLARITIDWEAASSSLKEIGVRHVIARTCPVLADKGGLLPLMALPVKLFAGGRFGTGDQAMPWIHVEDWVGAMVFLLENRNTIGVYNLIAPVPTSNAEFMRTTASVLKRPYWFHMPGWLLRMVLGEMSVMILTGRFIRPARLLEAGYRFKHPTLNDALQNLFRS